MQRNSLKRKSCSPDSAERCYSARLLATHPAVRIAAVVVLASCLAGGTWLQLLAAAIYLCCVQGLGAERNAAPCLAALWRLRVLFVAVPVVHWLAYGSAAGFYAVARDLCGLILMVITVALLLQPHTRPHELLCGLFWWMRPLCRLGFPGERCVVRLGITLLYIPWAVEALSRCRGNPRRRLVRLAWLLAGRGGRATPAPGADALAVTDWMAPGPTLLQWSGPLLLWVGLWGIGNAPAFMRPLF